MIPPRHCILICLFGAAAGLGCSSIDCIAAAAAAAAAFGAVAGPGGQEHLAEGQGAERLWLVLLPENSSLSACIPSISQAATVLEYVRQQPSCHPFQDGCPTALFFACCSFLDAIPSLMQCPHFLDATPSLDLASLGWSGAMPSVALASLAWSDKRCWVGLTGLCCSTRLLPFENFKLFKNSKISQVSCGLFLLLAEHVHSIILKRFSPILKRFIASGSTWRAPMHAWHITRAGQLFPKKQVFITFSLHWVPQILDTQAWLQNVELKLTVQDLGHPA
eukprot:1155506-Pelagomonas_calceolata.AAC.3